MQRAFREVALLSYHPRIRYIVVRSKSLCCYLDFRVIVAQRSTLGINDVA